MELERIVLGIGSPPTHPTLTVSFMDRGIMNTFMDSNSQWALYPPWLLVPLEKIHTKSYKYTYPVLFNSRNDIFRVVGLLRI